MVVRHGSNSQKLDGNRKGMAEVYADPFLSMVGAVKV